ncbi:hypothetical protein RBA41_06220 [Massilia sp. CCM 9210]|uniref:hypothetical protein n=1 Tax=Massilia scottii TaxID=3057166 RepID=UPI0027966D45|nr:hypothetical protein [Massilia sp. CCM 9210]MDQ1812896.1 hypothetical protein [Massilia sp. CCM 9210]
MLTWLYDEAGRASAILDEFCLRRAAGGWSRRVLPDYVDTSAALAPVAALLPAVRAAVNDLPG